MKGRLRDLEDKLKKTENSSWDNLRIGKRLLTRSSRQIIEDDDNHASEHGNEEQTQVNKEDSDPLFSMSPKHRMLPSNPGSPPRFSTTPQKKVNYYHKLHIPFVYIITIYILS